MWSVRQEPLTLEILLQAACFYWSCWSGGRQGIYNQVQGLTGAPDPTGRCHLQGSPCPPNPAQLKKSNQLQKSVTNVIVYSQPDRKKGHFHFYTFLNTLDEQVELNWKVKVLNWQRCDPARLPSPPNLAMLENWSKIFSTTLKTQVYNCSRRGLVMFW